MNANPFDRPLPVVVLLRSQQFATVEQMTEDRPPFCLLGRLGTEGPASHVLGAHGEHMQDHRAPTLWRGDGRWRESGEAHPHDIVGVVNRLTGEKVEVVPFAGAAGAKSGGVL